MCVPRGELVRSAEAAVSAAQRLGYPGVTKPLDGNHGRGVTIGLKAPSEVSWGFEQAREHGRTVIVEQHFTGADHRILVIGGEVVAVAERVPAHVVGDGRNRSSNSWPRSTATQSVARVTLASSPVSSST